MGYSVYAAFPQFFTIESPLARSLRLTVLFCAAALAACLFASTSVAQEDDKTLAGDNAPWWYKYISPRPPDPTGEIHPPVDRWVVGPPNSSPSPPKIPHFSTPQLPARFCTDEEKRYYVDLLFAEAQEELDAAIQSIRWARYIAQELQSRKVPIDLVGMFIEQEKQALNDADDLRLRSNELHDLALKMQGIPVEECQYPKESVEEFFLKNYSTEPTPQDDKTPPGPRRMDEELLEGALAPGPATTDDKALATVPATTDDKTLTTSPAPTTSASDATDKTGLLESAKKDVLGGTGNASISATSPSKEQLLEQAKSDAGVSTSKGQLLEQAKIDARSETPGTTSKVNEPTTAARSSTSSTTKDAGVKPRALSVQHSGSSAPTTSYRGPSTIGSSKRGFH